MVQNLGYGGFSLSNQPSKPRMIISRYTQLPRLLNRAAFHQFSTITTTGVVTQFLTDQVNTGIIQHDASQFHLAAKLDTLHDQLSATDASVLSDDQLSVETELVHRTYATPLAKFAAYSRKRMSTCFKQQLRPTLKGLYVHGSVGVGKTFTMDAYVFFFFFFFFWFLKYCFGYQQILILCQSYIY